MSVCAVVSPSLALVKYWGKIPGAVNLPATSSLAVTIGAVRSSTTIEAGDEDRVTIDGELQDMDRFLSVLNAVRAKSSGPVPVHVESTNSFPTAAGLASSSSGLAALALGLDLFYETGLERSELSAIARQGSGSAARAVYGGFTEWLAGSESASQVAPADYWPEVRVLIVIVRSGKKPVSSRAGMENTRLTSPFYPAWTETSDDLFRRARAALERRDIEGLGVVMRQSYLRMFSTMFTSEPPLIYWEPESLAVIRLCEELRAGGTAVWETMDAGPQVKLITLASHVPQILSALEKAVPGSRIIQSEVGSDPVVEHV